MIGVLTLASPMARWLYSERYIYILTDAFMSVQYTLLFHKLTQIGGYSLVYYPQITYKSTFVCKDFNIHWLMQ